MQKLKEKQKKFLGTVPKKCQLVETFWDCPEISKTNNNGITLIALIITIIVMLILVGVTINVALNGGLFTKARQATKQTQIEIDREQLLSAVVASLDKNLQIPNAETLQNNLASGWSVTGEDVGPFTATSPNGNVFTVDKNGTITGPNGETQTPEGDDEANTPTGEIPDLFRKYILGQDETGRLVTEIANMETMTFIDEEGTIPDASTSVSYLPVTTTSEGTTEMYAYIMYKEIVYKFIIDTTNYYTKSLEIEYKPQGNEGKDLGEVTGEEKYNGWIILYDDLNGTVEAVSPTAIGNLKLGCYDETAQTPGDIDENGIPNEDIDKAIYSYNNAIDRINNYCKEQVDDSLATDENVRSVGAAVDPRPNLNGDNAYNGIPSEWETSKYNGKGKSGDTEYEQDMLRMLYFENLYSENLLYIGEDYYLASRYANINSGDVNFNVRCVFSRNSHGGFGVWSVESNTTNTYYGPNNRCTSNNKGIWSLIFIKF